MASTENTQGAIFEPVPRGVLCTRRGTTLDASGAELTGPFHGGEHRTDIGLMEGRKRERR